MKLARGLPDGSSESASSHMPYITDTYIKNLSTTGQLLLLLSNYHKLCQIPKCSQFFSRFPLLTSYIVFRHIHSEQERPRVSNDRMPGMLNSLRVRVSRAGV